MTSYLKEIKNLLLNNKGTGQTIFKNILWLGASNVLSKILSLVLIIFAARILGAEEYGKFSFALAFGSLFMIFSDLGLSPIVTREFARKEEKKEEFHSVISLKFILALATFILILPSVFLATSQKDVREIILILALFLLANGIMNLFESFFHARQKMEYEAWFDTLQVIMIFGLGFFMLFKFPSVTSLSYAYFVSSLIVLIIMLLFFHVKIFPLKFELDFSVWKRFLKISWPLALISLFGVIYNYTDSVMMGFSGMFEETGWYNAAQRIIIAGLIPMGLVGASFYPALSKFSHSSKEKFQEVWDYELEIMILLALPLVVGGLFLAPKIISAFYPADFTPSILTFQILIFTAGITFLYRPFYDAMIILDQQAKTFWITVAGAIINVLLNSILIPRYSLYGASVATVIANLVVLVVIVFYAKKFTSILLSYWRIFLTLLASSVSTAVMYFIIKQPVIYNLNIFLLVLIGAVFYFSVFYLIRQYVFSRYIQHAYAKTK